MQTANSVSHTLFLPYANQISLERTGRKRDRESKLRAIQKRERTRNDRERSRQGRQRVIAVSRAQGCLLQVLLFGELLSKAKWGTKEGRQQKRHSRQKNDCSKQNLGLLTAGTIIWRIVFRWNWGTGRWKRKGTRRTEGGKGKKQQRQGQGEAGTRKGTGKRDQERIIEQMTKAWGPILCTYIYIYR